MRREGIGSGERMAPRRYLRHLHYCARGLPQNWALQPSLQPFVLLWPKSGAGLSL